MLGSDKDAGGNDDNKEDALSYAASNSVSIGTFDYYQTALSSSQIQKIKNDLDNGNYVIGNLFASGFGGHSVVIKDYNSSNQFRILDPWDLTDIYYSSTVFSSASFPVGGSKGRIEWIQYCR